MKPSTVFLIVLIPSLVVQGLLWRNDYEFIDQKMWIEHIKHIQKWDDQIFDKGIYGHPGATVIDLTIVINKLTRIPIAESFLIALPLIISVIIAGASTITYQIRPQNKWWIAVAGMLIFNRLYVFSTPPTAIMSPLLVLLFLLGIFIFENATLYPRWPIYLWGALAGTAAATRTDITGLYMIIWLPLFLYRIGPKRTFMIILSSLVFFIIINPFMWHAPKQHIFDLLGVINHHYQSYGNHVVKMSISTILFISPIATVSFIIILLWFFLDKKHKYPLPRQSIFATILFTATLTAIILSSRYKAQRYFYPALFLWEILLPIYILEGIKKFDLNFINKIQQNKVKNYIQVFFIVLLVCGQGLMLWHLLALPEVIVVDQVWPD